MCWVSVGEPGGCRELVVVFSVRGKSCRSCEHQIYYVHTYTCTQACARAYTDIIFHFSNIIPFILEPKSPCSIMHVELVQLQL